jgi:uncharacterized repeat protein (TIGR01451 family)
MKPPGNIPRLIVNGTLLAAESIDVVDLLTGSATPGAGNDYTNVANVVIPAGVYAGTVATAINLTINDDALTEGNETINLSLANPSAGLTIGDANTNGTTQATNTYTIVDDEIPSIDLQLTKTANKREVTVGDVVTYSVALANTVVTDVVGVDVRDQLPPNFKYVAGSARLDGAPLADPTGNRPLVFTIGTVLGLVDTNGNGVADPGEVGYRLLTYKLVVGSGATPGDYDNTATAIDVIGNPFSNADTARVSVIQDTLFDLGTIIGKVFEDKNEDGIQNLDEPGVPNVMVALDNGTYALTDAYGRYHFPAVTPGQRLVKINLQSVPGNARATTDVYKVLSVTEGLLAKANFGIRYEHTIEKIGEPAKRGLAVTTEISAEPIRILGNTESMTVLVNDAIAALPKSSIQFKTASLDDSLEYNANGLKAPVGFDLNVDSPKPIASWQLFIRDASDQFIRTLSGAGSPPRTLPWDGLNKDGTPLDAGDIYRYQLVVTFTDGVQSKSASQLFGVNRATAVSLNLSGGAFEPGSHGLTPRALKLLKDTAKVIRQFPREKIVIEGHTDAQGSADFNLDLSKRRALIALKYLIEVERLPANQFIVRWHGESEPVATNATDQGRELNRRVEITSKLTKVKRAKLHDQIRDQDSQVVIDDTVQAVNDEGRFAAEVAVNGQTHMAIEVKDSQGGLVQGAVPLPTVEILQLQRQLLAAGDATSLYQVHNIVDGPSTNNDAIVLNHTLVGRTDPNNVVEVDGRPSPVDAHGFFVDEIELKQGVNTFGLVVRNPAGYMRIANLRVMVADEEDGRPVLATEPVPNLAVKLPPRGVPLTTAQLVIPGGTDPGNSVAVNGQPVVVQANGEFFANVTLPVGESRVAITVTDANGHTGTIERVVVRKQGLFFMAFADATISRLTADGFIQGAGLSDDSETVKQGRVAYYLKGTIKGKYLITSAFDSGTNEFDELFSDLDETENDRLMTNLDPDKFYPVYGDDSTIVYDSESQGKFYLALDSDTLHALIGNYAINLSDTELAAYRRTLYGGQVAYESLAHTAYGQPHTKAQAFVAEVRQASVSDELNATGGSLYYLSQREVIEGSEQVSIVVRDKDTNLELSRTPQQRNIDYAIKYEEGRILFNAPIASVSSDNQLIDGNLLAGNPVFIHVNYETRLDTFEQTSTGGRVRQQLGDHFALGTTYVKDEQMSGDYELEAVDAEIRFGKNSRIVAEVAESSGTDATSFISTDGGFTYNQAGGSATQSGDAYKLAAELDVGEWFGKPDKLAVGAYVKRLEDGFSSDGTGSEEGTEKQGLNFRYHINDKQLVRGSHDQQEALTGPVEATETVLQWQYAHPRWRVTGEVQDLVSTDSANVETDSTTAAARFDIDWTEKLAAFVEHQNTLDGPDNDQTTVGVDYRLRDRLALKASATDGSNGEAAEVGLVYDLDKHRLYVSERVVNDTTRGRSTATVLGSESALGEDGSVYTEYQWGRSGGEDTNQSLVGARKRWGLTDGLSVLLSGEYSEIDTTPTVTTRYALAAGVSYDNGRGLKLSTRNEVRREEGGRDLDQFLSTNHAEYAFTPDLKILGTARYSLTSDSAIGPTEAEFDELSIGLAYRPVNNDDFNLLARYTTLLDGPSQFQAQTDDLIAESEVLSVEWSHQVTPDLEWVGKQAFKNRVETTPGAGDVETETSLTIQRLNYNFYKDFELGAEYRVLAQQDSDQRDGWLLEFMWRPIDHLRIGVGYNFTDFSDDEFSNNDYSVKGWFLRLQGAY